MSFLLNKKICQIKTRMCFFCQPIIGCLLLRGKFCPKCLCGAQKMSAISNVFYESVRYIEVFLWGFDRDSTNSLKKCPLLPGVRYNISAIDRSDCILKEIILLYLFCNFKQKTSLAIFMSSFGIYFALI